MQGPLPTEAQLRRVAFALFGGAAAVTIAVPIVLLCRAGVGVARIPELDFIAPTTAPLALIGAAMARVRLQRKGAAAPAEEAPRFAVAARLVPLGLLEGAAMFNAVGWLCNGTAWPYVLPLLLLLGALAWSATRAD